jgi:HSP20 family protein
MAPVHGAHRWERDMDWMLEYFFGRRMRPWWPERWSRAGEFDIRTPAVDLFEENDDIVVKAELPGIDRDNIDVNLSDHTLTIKAEKKKEEEIKEENYFFGPNDPMGAISGHWICRGT